jgi:hypothetical protein
MACARRTRRLAIALLLLAVAAALWQRRSARPAADDPPPSWPPFADPSRSADGNEQAPRGFAASATAPRWVPPVDGACPAGYPVKANDNSGIYHLPGGRFYERTVPERCYTAVEDAEADGYRRAKA